MIPIAYEVDSQMNIRFLPAVLVLLSIQLLCLSATASGARIHRSPTAGHSKKTHLKRHRTVSHRIHGQQSIEPGRATQIQQALIREHYLTGDPSGKWDAATQAAMVKFQADNGWQTKLAPDSRALIKLGLGPDHSDALNGSAITHADPLPKPDPSVDNDSGLIAASGISN
jgi:hypothetical protein